MDANEFLKSIGTNMCEMAEVQEKIEGGEIDEPQVQQGRLPDGSSSDSRQDAST
jgi:hypothetical protein